MERCKSFDGVLGPQCSLSKDHDLEHNYNWKKCSTRVSDSGLCVEVGGPRGVVGVKGPKYQITGKDDITNS